MGDESRFRIAYDALIERMPDPPAFESITTIEPRRTSPFATLPSWAPATGLVVLAVVAIGALALFEAQRPDTADSSPTGRDPATPPLIEEIPSVGDGEGFQEGLMFGQALPWTLLFDNGYDEVRAIDVNVGVPYDIEIPGAGPGEPPFRLIEVDNWLIVGSGSIVSHSITTRESTHLGNATVYVPAAEQGRVWLVDYQGRIGANPPVVWQVSPGGEELTERVTVNVAGNPMMGIPGGLAIETDEGIALWDLASGEVSDILGSDPSSRVSDVSPLGQVAWCHRECYELEITWIETGESFRVGHPEPGIRFVPGEARFSSDGRFLAAPTRSDLVVIDVTTGDIELIELAGREFDYVNWAPSGPDLFASTYSYGERAMTVAHVNALSGAAEVVDLPFGGALDFVVVPTEIATSFLSFECPVTIPSRSGFLAPEPWPAHYPLDDDLLWYGTEGLWTALPVDPSDYGPRKSVWWSTNFTGGFVEGGLDISVFWQRLDADAPAIHQFEATNAMTEEEGWFMIAGSDPPELGCWRVTASFEGSTLTYVYDNR
jgi:hypothetical protein